MRIQDILDEEGREALRMDGGFSVEDVVHLMMDTDKSALIVTEGERPTRIFTEMDVLPSHARFKPKDLFDITPRNVVNNN